MRIERPLLVLGLAVVLAGCDAGGSIAVQLDVSDVAETQAPDVPVDVTVDAVEATPEASEPDVLRDAVVPERYLPAKSVRIEGAGRDGELHVVRLVARDFEPLYGIALRVEWDPSLAEYASGTTETPFGTGGVYRIGQVRPGSLAIGMAHESFHDETPLSGDVTLATIKLRALSDAPIALSFFGARCLAVAERLAKVEGVTYLGATLHP